MTTSGVLNMTATTDPASYMPPLGIYELVSTLVEAWIYGLNCILYILAVYIICRRRPFMSILVVSSTCLIIFATCHIWINGTALYRALEAALAMQADMQTEMESTPFYCQACSAGNLSLTGTVLYLLTIFTQDLILLWRLFVVWQRWWVAALVGVIDVAALGCIIPGLISIANPANTYISPAVYRLVVPFYALHLLFNLSVTVLIIYKLWRMGRQLEQFFPGHGGAYARGIGVMVESGVIYTVATAINLGLFVAGMTVAYILTNILTQLATLTPLLIVVRVGFSLSLMSSASSPASAGLHVATEVSRESPVTRMIRGRQTKMHQRSGTQSREQAIHVAVEREVDCSIIDHRHTPLEWQRDSFDLEMEDLARKGELNPEEPV